MIAAAVESGAGVPFDCLMDDSDVLEATEEYLEWRAQELNKRRG